MQIILTPFKNKGKILEEMQKFKEALACYDNVIYLGPSDFMINKNKGECLFEMNMYEEAIACFDILKKCDPFNFDAYYYKGRCLEKLKRYSEAKDYFNRAIQLNLSYSSKIVYKM